MGSHARTHSFLLPIQLQKSDPNTCDAWSDPLWPSLLQFQEFRKSFVFASVFVY